MRKLSIEEIVNSKTYQFLKVNHRMEATQAAHDHYAWEQQHFRRIKDEFYMTPDTVERFFKMLCTSFGVYCPEITVQVRNSNRAMTLVLDDCVAFGIGTLSVGCVLHEFAHWYFWSKYRMFVGHSTPIMMRFIADLSMITGSVFCGLDLHHNFENALADIGHAGPVELAELKGDA